MPESGTSDAPVPSGGRVAILTRSAERNAALRGELEADGLAFVDLPCFRTEPARDPAALAKALLDLGERDVLVLTSVAGPSAVAGVLDPSGVRVPVAAVGAATAAAARAAGLRVTFVPSRPDGATLAAELPLPAGEVVLARSDRAARDLPEILRRRGARVRELEAYRTVPGVGGDVAAARASLAGGDAVVLFASPSAVEGMLDGLPLELVRRAAIVAIGPSTAAAVRQRLGVEPLVARGTGTPEIARAVRAAARGGVPA